MDFAWFRHCPRAPLGLNLFESLVLVKHCKTLMVMAEQQAARLSQDHGFRSGLTDTTKHVCASKSRVLQARTFLEFSLVSANSASVACVTGTSTVTKLMYDHKAATPTASASCT